MIVRTCRIEGNQRLQLDKEPAIMVRRPDATMEPAPHDIQPMLKHRVLSFKPQLRLEWRGQDGQHETEQPDHSASLGDSITSSTRIRFSVHTAAQASLTLQPAGLLSRLKRPLSRGSSPFGYPAEPLVSYQINRQLPGWNLPPLMIRAFGAHCHNLTS
jgi:hypothetical protein